MSNVLQVENYLRKIHQLSDSVDANLDAVALVQDLKSLVFIDMDDRDAAAICSLLFKGQFSVLSFLRLATPNQDKTFVKTKEQLFMFIHEYIKKVGGRVQEFALDIKVFLILKKYFYSNFCSLFFFIIFFPNHIQHFIETMIILFYSIILTSTFLIFNLFFFLDFHYFLFFQET